MAKAVLLIVSCVFASFAWTAELTSIEVSNESKRYFVRSSAMLDAPINDVYDTLIDFDNYEKFSSVYDDARWLTRNADDSGEIYTYTRGCILFVCRGFGRTETVVATKPTFIETKVDPERSKVRYGVSVWHIEAVGDQTKIEFALDFEPDFWVPPVIGPFVVKRFLRKGGVDALNRIEELAQLLPEQRSEEQNLAPDQELKQEQGRALREELHQKLIQEQVLATHRVLGRQQLYPEQGRNAGQESEQRIALTRGPLPSQ